MIIPSIIKSHYWGNPKAIIYRILILFPQLIKSDSLFLKLAFYVYTGRKLDLEHPKTFNEKLQWLKLYDRNPKYIKMVDKVEAKKYVASIIGMEHIIPTIAIYDRVEDIDFDTLPKQFVLKCTHDSGGIVICKDKNKLNKKQTIDTLQKGLQTNYYWQNREWPYKNVKRRILAEEYKSNDGKELIDYKFLCYNGVCKNIFVCTGRSKHDLRVDFFDTKWNHLPFIRKYKNSDEPIPKPEKLDEMIYISEKIAHAIGNKFIRIDLYFILQTIYFGEITFYPGSGIELFTPNEWDYKLGDLIELDLND